MRLAACVNMLKPPSLLGAGIEHFVDLDVVAEVVVDDDDDPPDATEDAEEEDEEQMASPASAML
jgi:hypothetical protein